MRGKEETGEGGEKGERGKEEKSSWLKFLEINDGRKRVRILRAKRQSQC